MTELFADLGRRKAAEILANRVRACVGGGVGGSSFQVRPRRFYPGVFQLILAF